MNYKNKNVNFVYNKVKKYLTQKLGKHDTDIILDIFGRNENFINTVCLLPFWFNESFYTKTNPERLITLSEANLKSWIGYTLYDYIRDGKIQKNKINKLFSISNIINQDALRIFIRQSDLEIKILDSLSLYNKVDLFYIKESDNLIPNDFNKFCGMVHEKSIAAATCALIVTPEKIYRNYKNNIINFFKYYFTARQLSDDFDDYKKDLKKKILTPMTLLLKQGKTEDEARILVRKEIDKNFNRAITSIQKIPSFDHENFIKKYMKPC